MTSLRIDAVDFPCRITMGAMVRFKRKSGRDVSALQQGDLTHLLLFLHCCCASACCADGVDFPYDFDTFADKLSPDDLHAFYAGLPTPPAGSEGEKKMEGELPT